MLNNLSLSDIETLLSKDLTRQEMKRIAIQRFGMSKSKLHNQSNENILSWLVAAFENENNCTKVLEETRT